VDCGTSAGSAWIQLDFPSAVTVGRVAFDTMPTTATCVYSAGRTLAGGTLQYWTGSSWATITSVSGQTNDWSRTFTPVTTTRIRLNALFSYSTSNAVIFEWFVHCE
jgi:hypothetical protein